MVTISRETESLGDEIADYIAQKMDFQLIGRERVDELVRERGKGFPETIDDQNSITEWLREVRELIIELSATRPVLFLGRGGQKIFDNMPDTFHALVVSSPEIRIRRIMEKYNQDSVTASRILAEQDQQRERFHSRFLGVDWRNPCLYHIVLNTAWYDLPEAGELFLKAIQGSREAPDTGMGQELRPRSQDLVRKKILFSHPSEGEFARILNFYGIRWLYEPRTFPLEWDGEGNVVEAFSPDFYLPDFDLFIELTTQRQKLVWKKNRKVRRLKELYPEVKVKVIYSRDYSHLLSKFGVEEH